MFPRVIYWTGIWEPHREALSKEVELLRRLLRPDSLVVSFSAGQRSSIDWGGRVVRLSGRRYFTLRLLAIALERTTDITHMFGSIDCWHFLKALGSRPSILTVAIGGRTLPGLYDNISLFAVQAPPLRQALLDTGVPPERIRLIYPGIDLAGYTETAAPPHTPFTVLFASTPADAAEFDARGIPLIVQVAQKCPDITFLLLWRQWGDINAARRALEDLHPPGNVVIRHEDAEDMAPVYASAHAVICCFAKDFGKACPNSVMEALAAGRPVIVSREVGLAEVIAAEGPGVVVERNAESVKAGLDSLRHEYSSRQARARRTAEMYFNLEHATREYAALYQQLSSGNESGVA